MLDFMKPLEILVCWQAILVAMVCAGFTRLIKAVVDAKLGKPWRSARPWFGDLILPTCAVLIGVLFAVIVPVRPDVLDSYIERKLVDAAPWKALVVYAVWGGVCGQLSSYAYDRVVGLFRAIASTKKSDSNPPPPMPKAGEPIEIKDPNE